MKELKLHSRRSMRERVAALFPTAPAGEEQSEESRQKNTNNRKLNLLNIIFTFGRVDLQSTFNSSFCWYWLWSHVQLKKTKEESSFPGREALYCEVVPVHASAWTGLFFCFFFSPHSDNRFSTQSHQLSSSH